MSAFFEQFLSSLFAVTDPSRRFYWVFILSSALLAVVVLRRTERASPVQMLRQLFSSHYWLSKSSQVDLWFFGLNAVVRALLGVLFVGGQLGVTIAVAYYLQSTFGTVQSANVPWLLVASAYTLTFFVCEDVSRFGLHVLMHRVPWLWSIHKTHHSATTLTPLTLFRVHPIEMLLYYLRGMLVFGLVSGVFLYAFGRQLSGLDILGVDALGFLFNLMGANLRHSHIWLSFGRLEHWFISPAQHQLHHSSHPAHTDCNFGTCLAVWDRWLGSWIAAARKPAGLRFGLAEVDRSHPVETKSSSGWLRRPRRS